MKKIISILLALALTLSFSGCFFGSGFSSNRDFHNDTPLSNDNPYIFCYSQYYDYILADSCSRYLNWQDLYGLSAQELYLAEQEIYARHGYTFSEWDVQEYFDNREWYQPSQTQEELSDYASMNAYFIGVFTAVQDGSIYDWGNPYLALCSNDFVLSFSSSRELTDSDLAGLSSKELAIARNEIFARHGYIFGDTELRTYFYTKPWYRPSSLSTNFNFGSLSDLENANVELIQYYEDITPATDSGNGGGNGGNGGNNGNNGSTGNSGNNGSNHDNTGAGFPSHVTAVDKYTYLVENSCYHIPYVDLPSAAAINQQMYSDCYDLLQRHVFAYPDQVMLWSMTYAVGRCGDVVSVLVYSLQDWGCDVILVYNFSASTGRKLSNSEVFGAYGLSEADGRNKLCAAIEAYWAPQLINPPGGSTEAAQSCKDRTLADSNLAEWTPYIDVYGSLCFTGPVYSIAGAECYDRLLDQSGTRLSGPTCSIH